MKSFLRVCLCCLFLLCLSAPACAAGGSMRDFAHALTDIPQAYLEPCAQQGSVERIEYDTCIYANNGAPGRAGVNEAYVYLPYGYDPQGRYNVLYLMHGKYERAGYWLAQDEYAPGASSDRDSVTRNVLDHLIAEGRCEPVIVVTPCMDAKDKSGFNGANTFRYEFRNDLVPAVETRYATYAKGDASAESLTASRAHRAYAGLSLGSSAGWSSILLGCMDYVGYVGNFSGYYSNAYNVADALNTTFRDYPILYWYNGNGSKDSTYDDHSRAYGIMLKLCPDILTEDTEAGGGNCCFIAKPGMYHNYNSALVDLYNVMHVFF